jgi:hypothetical protein
MSFLHRQQQRLNGIDTVAVAQPWLAWKVNGVSTKKVRAISCGPVEATLDILPVNLEGSFDKRFLH